MSNDPPPFSLRSSSGSSKNKQNQAQAQAQPPPPPQEESSPNLPKSPSFGALPGPMPPPASAGSLRRNNAQHCRSSSQGGQPVPNDHPVRGVFTVHLFVRPYIMLSSYERGTDTLVIREGSMDCVTWTADIGFDSVSLRSLVCVKFRLSAHALDQIEFWSADEEKFPKERINASSTFSRIPFSRDICVVVPQSFILK